MGQGAPVATPPRAGWGVEIGMECGTCGARLTDRDRYCAACGMPNMEGRMPPRFGPVAEESPLYPEPRQPRPGEILCLRCERPTPRTDEYCTWCGMDVEAAVLRADRSPTEGVWSSVGPDGAVPYRSLGPLTAPLRALLHVVALLTLVARGLLAARFVTLEGGTVAGVEADALATWSDAVLWLVGGLGLLAAVVMLLWSRRAARNLRALSVRDARFPAWVATWCWFLPLADLVLPYLMVEDLWRSSGADGPPMTARRRYERPPFSVHLWWPCVVLGVLLLGIARLSMPASLDIEIDTWRVVFVLGSIGALVLVVGALSLAIVVDEVRARQDRRADVLGPPDWLEQHRGPDADDEVATDDEPAEPPVALRAQDAGPTWGKY